MAGKVKRGLSDDVSEYGAVLGQVITDQVGRHVLQHVEMLRQQAKTWRAEGDSAWDEFRDQVINLPDAHVGSVIRSFSSFFQVVNLLEHTQRIRRGREYLYEGKIRPETFQLVIRDLKQRGVGLDQISSALSGLSIEPVFTAHPTQARRRLILGKEQQMAALMLQRQLTRMTAPELAELHRCLRRELTLCWQTREHPDAPLSVDDERESVLFALTRVLFPAIPTLYGKLAEAIDSGFGTLPDKSELPLKIRFGSWVGGDMDGNPHVTASSVSDALEDQRSVVIACFRETLQNLSRELTQTRGVVTVDAAVSQQSRHYAGWFPRAARRINARHENMPYRVFLNLMSARLVATKANAEHAYPNPQAFIEDLRRIQRSLAQHRGSFAGTQEIANLICCVATFGFHLASLDIRQDGRHLRSVVGRLIGRSDWEQSSAGERCYHLARSLSDETPSLLLSDPESTALLDVFKTIGNAKQRYGKDAIGLFVVSMAEALDDLLCVLQMAQWAGLGDRTGQVDLDIVPLFETVRDLRSAPRIMQAALANSVYRKHLQQRGNRQWIMLGYSDSSKQAGAFTSRWLVVRAQHDLQTLFSGVGVDVAFFHGRGGSISRGGGKISDAIGAGAMDLHSGVCRFTEQGEMVHRNFSIQGIAERYLEQIGSAVLQRCALRSATDRRESQWRGIMATIARESSRYYRAMVFENPHFMHYFRCATPIDIIERMSIGSRPHSRNDSGKFEDLRAIPWVFAWMQSRHLLPAWYGFGSGLQSAVEKHGHSVVADLLKHWPLAQQMFGDIELAMSRVDLRIASAYADLDTSTRGKLIFGDIRDEFQRTVRWILKLKNAPSLLADRRVIQRATALRNPYLDPLNLLQIRLLSEWRAAGRPNDTRQELLMNCVSGIADGMQNTG